MEAQETMATMTGLACGIMMTVEEAKKNAEQAALENLRGAYPMATRVLGKEVMRLREALEEIACPKRGSEAERWNVEEIGRFAAKTLEAAS